MEPYPTKTTNYIGRTLENLIFEEKKDMFERSETKEGTDKFPCKKEKFK